MLFNLEQSLITTECVKNKLLKDLTTVKCGGVASYYFKPYYVKDLISIIDFCKSDNLKVKIIGNGSNIVFSDNGYNGAIVSLKGLTSVDFIDGKIRAYAGASVNKVINFANSIGYASLEKLIGIPATIGGMTVMNASAFNYMISNNIYSVCTINNGKLKFYNKKDCKFGYRKSKFLSSSEVVLFVDFDFTNCDVKSAENIKTYCLNQRLHNQPNGFSCGSVFKNPKNDYAGRLIERSMLKGERVGGAFVSNKHANFIINDGTATALDFYKLTNKIQTCVYDKFGVKLCTEVEFVGEFL